MQGTCKCGKRFKTYLGFEQHTDAYPRMCSPAYRRDLRRREDIEWLKDMLAKVAHAGKIRVEDMTVSSVATGLAGPLGVQSITASVFWHARHIRRMCLSDIASIMGRTPSTVSLSARRFVENVWVGGWDKPRRGDTFTAEDIVALAAKVTNARKKYMVSNLREARQCSGDQKQSAL